MRTSNPVKTPAVNIQRLGHTSSNQYGTNPRAKNAKRGEVRDERAGK